MDNLVFRNDTGISLKNGLTATGTVSSDPLFAGYSHAAALPNFQLGASSPAIGRGRGADTQPFDVDGAPRNDSIELGAYAY
jgi:hypothetical protein